MCKGNLFQFLEPQNIKEQVPMLVLDHFHNCLICLTSSPKHRNSQFTLMLRQRNSSTFSQLREWLAFLLKRLELINYQKSCSQFIF